MMQQPFIYFTAGAVSKATNRQTISSAADYESRKAMQQRLVEQAKARGLSLERAALLEIAGNPC